MNTPVGRTRPNRLAVVGTRGGAGTHIAAAALAALAAGCGTGPPGESQAWQGTVTETENGRLVRTTGGSVWSGAAELVEAATFGVAEGDPSLMFGRIRGVQADDERIWVLDLASHVLRAYDHDGKHLADVRRGGNGPGEFARPWILGLDDTGRVYVVDLGQGRLHVFSSRGELQEDWTNVRGVVQVTRDGSVFIRRLLPDRSRGLQ